jgi:hypothetical protein
MIGKVLSFFLFVSLFAACGGGESVHWPEGNVDSGKEVFSKLQCWGCHEVVGEEYPDPTAITPTFVSLGSPDRELSQAYLIESIIAPSHQFATPKPPEGQVAGEDNVRMGARSKMTDYSESLTIKELWDLVAYLEHLQGS